MSIPAENPAPKTADYKELEVRQMALQLALSGNHCNMNAEAVIARAQAFEAYIVTGKPPVNTSTANLDARLTQAFETVTSSMEASMF